MTIAISRDLVKDTWSDPLDVYSQWDEHVAMKGGEGSSHSGNDVDVDSLLAGVIVVRQTDANWVSSRATDESDDDAESIVLDEEFRKELSHSIEQLHKGELVSLEEVKKQLGP